MCPVVPGQAIIGPVRVDVDGAAVHYELEGDGPACLALAPVGIEWLRRAVPMALRELLQLVMVEPRGTGSSMGGAEAWSVAAVTEDLDAVRRACRLDDALVFGHSMNGLFALDYAARHPDVVRGVMAICTPPTMPPDGERRQVSWAAAAADRRAEHERRLALAQAAPEGSPQKMALWQRAERVRRWHDWDLDTTALDDVQELNADWLQHLLRAMEPVPWSDVFAQVRCPVLLVSGASDHACPASLWDGVSPPPRTSSVTFARSGHTPFFEEPDAFVEVVRSWLATLGQPVDAREQAP